METTAGRKMSMILKMSYAVETEDTSVLLAETEVSSCTMPPIPIALNMQLRNWRREERKKPELNTTITKSLCQTYISVSAFSLTDLFVHQHVDHWVVQGWALGKEGRDGCSQCPEGGTFVHEDPASEGGIWSPGDQEAEHHQDTHACHFLLSLLGGGRLLLLGCSLKKEFNRAESERGQK